MPSSSKDSSNQLTCPYSRGNEQLYSSWLCVYQTYFHFVASLTFLWFVYMTLRDTNKTDPFLITELLNGLLLFTHVMTNTIQHSEMMQIGLVGYRSILKVPEHSFQLQTAQRYPAGQSWELSIPTNRSEAKIKL